jgi:hypothetical protein
MRGGVGLWQSWAEQTVICCWPLPAQSFLVLCHMGPMTIFFCLALLTESWVWFGYVTAGKGQHSHFWFWVSWDSWPYFSVSQLWEVI